MDINITEKLTELLNDPEGLERIKNVASSLFSEKEITKILGGIING